MQLRVDKHQGMGNLIAKEKLPAYLYQKIHNLELSKRLGRLVKRGGYKNILTAAASNLAALKGMFEFTDSNDGRQILLQDGTGLEESVYSGGAYVAASAIVNDERESAVAPTVTQMYPVLHEKTLRSGAGIAATHDHPFWYGYKDAVIRFPNSGDAETIAAGKYLEDQFYGGALNSLITLSATANEQVRKSECELTPEKSYGVYCVPVIDGSQRFFPEIAANTFQVVKMPEAPTPGIGVNLNILITISDANKDAYKRITAIDIFVTGEIDYISTDPEIYPAYFLERVPLDDDGEYIFSITGDSDNGASTITYDDILESNWQPYSLELEGGDADYIYNETQDEVYRITAQNGVLNTLTVTPAPTATQAGDTFKFFSRWRDDGSGYIYQTFYDNHYKKLGSEMYTYLNIPIGDTGLDDYRYKFSCMANRRYFIFGMPDGAFGYYSKVDNPDVISSLNILRLKKEPTGCVAVGRDVMVFSPSSAERFTILGDANADKDDEFSDIGLVSQKALFKVGDEEVFGFDLRGPWQLYGRRHRFIGSLLQNWWDDELSDAEKNACVVSYNRLKDWVLYSFPDYTGTHDGFTYTGIIFVFDRGYYLKSGRQIEPWWIIETDHLLKNSTIAEDDDLHLLTGSATAIVDWNETTRASQDETVKTLAHLKLLQNPILGNKTHFDMLYLYYVSATDSIVGKIKPDGGSWATLTINSDKQAFMKYIADTLEVEISTAASANDVELSEEIITFSPLRK